MGALDTGRAIGHPALVPKPVLKPNEIEIEIFRANRSQGGRAVGGHLLLTDQRLVFYAHKVDSSTGGKNWECPLKSISGVRMSARGLNPLNGSMRRRLQIDCAGATTFFVVNRGDVITAAIGQALQAGAP
jgi:hypothetical protein